MAGTGPGSTRLAREGAAALAEALGREEGGRAGSTRHAHVVARELVADAEVGDLRAHRQRLQTITSPSKSTWSMAKGSKASRRAQAQAP